MTVRLDIYGVIASFGPGSSAEITSDVISDIQFDGGITGKTPNDRLADTGTMTFRLKNWDGKYTPGGSGALAGWKVGIEIYLLMVYDGDGYVRFRGTLREIKLHSNEMGYSEADVTIVDWMEHAAEHPILTPALATYQRADQAINLILDLMPIKPVEKSMESGLNIFPSVFDTVRRKGVAYTEFAKLVDSEMGFLYLWKAAGSGEELVFENAHHRNGLVDYDEVPVLTAESDTRITEAGDDRITEAGDTRAVSSTELVTFDDIMIDLEVDHGANTATRLVMTAYPRKVDTSLVVLYSLGSPMQIGGGETKTWTASYTDPSGGQNVGGFNMQVPVATTDYLLNTLSDGSGTNLTSSAVVTVTFGANSAQITVQNPTTSSGYITLFNLRGYGIYTYAEAEIAVEDMDSINQYGYIERSFDQKYQGDLSYATLEANRQIYLDHAPRTVLQSISYLANATSEMMMAFLNLDVGSLIEVSESHMGISGAYFIQNVNCRVQVGGLIWVTYGLVEHLSLLTGTLTPLVLETAFGDPAGLNFGYLPQVVQTSERSFAAWVWDIGTGYTTPDNRNIFLSCPFADGGGIYLWVGSAVTHRVGVYTNLFQSGTPGLWRTLDTGTVPTGQWVHIVITYDCWDIAADPVIYVNGVSKTVEEVQAPTGTLASEYGAEVVLGNWHTVTQNYGMTHDGYLKDVRICKKILTQAEVTALYNGGTPDASLVTDGLVFQGPCVPTRDVADYDGGAAISAKQQVIDNIYQAVGTPHKAVNTWLWSEK